MGREEVLRVFRGILNDARRNYYIYDPPEIDELERWINGAPADLPFEDVCSEIGESCAQIRRELEHKISTYRKVKEIR